MESSNALAVIAIAVSLAAVCLSGYAIISDNGDSGSGPDMDAIKEQIELLQTKGGKLYTIGGGTFEGKSFTLEGSTVVYYSGTYKQHVYIPVDTIDRILINGRSAEPLACIPWRGTPRKAECRGSRRGGWPPPCRGP